MLGYLREFQLDRRCAAKNRDRDLQALVLFINFFDHTVEIFERTVRNFNLLTDLEVDQRDKSWLEIEAQNAPGKIEAALMSIWKSASRRDLDSDELGALEARVARSLGNNGLLDRLPGSMSTAMTSDHGGSESGFQMTPDGPIIHDVIVVMELGRRVNR